MVSRSFFFFFRGSIVPSILSISSLNTGTGGAKEDSGRPDVTLRAEQISLTKLVELKWRQLWSRFKGGSTQDDMFFHMFFLRVASRFS